MLGVGLDAHIPEVAEAAADIQSSLPQDRSHRGPCREQMAISSWVIGGECSKATVYKGKARDGVV